MIMFHLFMQIWCSKITAIVILEMEYLTRVGTHTYTFAKEFLEWEIGVRI